MITKKTIIKKILSKISQGSINVQFPDGEHAKFGNGKPFVNVSIKSNKAIAEMLSQGDIGFGRGYIEGWWECDNLAAMMDIMTQNITHIEKTIYGNKFYNFVYKIYDFFKRNTPTNSKKNIEYHYDLGNNFYFKWLDETKSYSSALFKGEESLKEAQQNKYRNIIKHLPKNTETILEIGCGWGGFIQEMINTKSDIKIKGLTLSSEQFTYVAEKFANNQNIQPTIQDYRNETSQYNAIVSIEMFEAVGMEYWKTYMQKAYDCLKPNGIAIIQTITIENSAFEKYIKTSDFIRHFIFPGGILPTPEIFQKIAQECGLEVIELENFGNCYRRTLLIWLEKFNAIKEEILALGFDEKFIRKWQMYLAYCAAGFGSGRTDVYQFVLRKNA
jgi:cyclopropane-fatty-acyl-phospholipid synthase